jgi:hypothetical protein
MEIEWNPKSNLLFSMKKMRHRTTHQGSGGALLSEKKPHRKPVFSLTPKQVFQLCRESCHALICAGQVLAVMDLMLRAGWPIGVLAQRAHVSESHLSEFLRLKKFFTTDIVSRVAAAFGLKLSKLDELAEEKVEKEDSL